MDSLMLQQNSDTCKLDITVHMLYKGTDSKYKTAYLYFYGVFYGVLALYYKALRQMWYLFCTFLEALLLICLTLYRQ